MDEFGEGIADNAETYAITRGIIKALKLKGVDPIDAVGILLFAACGFMKYLAREGGGGDAYVSPMGALLTLAQDSVLLACEQAKKVGISPEERLNAFASAVSEMAEIYGINPDALTIREATEQPPPTPDTIVAKAGSDIRAREAVIWTENEQGDLCVKSVKKYH